MTSAGLESSVIHPLEATGTGRRLEGTAGRDDPPISGQKSVQDLLSRLLEDAPVLRVNGVAQSTRPLDL